MKIHLRDGIPWWSSSQDSVLSLPRAQVQSLVGELGSHKPCICSTTKKKKKEKIHLRDKTPNILCGP